MGYKSKLYYEITMVIPVVNNHILLITLYSVGLLAAYRCMRFTFWSA